MNKNFVDERMGNFVSSYVRRKHRMVFCCFSGGVKSVSRIYSLVSEYKDILSILWLGEKAEEVVVKEGDPLSFFYSSVDILRVKFSECDVVLGNTYDMVVIENFGKCEPNVLAKAVETVCGGGVIVFLFEGQEEQFSLYRTRMYKTLMSSACVIAVDSNFNLIDREMYEVEGDEEIVTEEFDFQECEGNFEEIEKMCLTHDQKKGLRALLSVLERNSENVVGITADRGRGKSALLGLTVACGIKNGLRRIVVFSPSIENLKVFFEFLILGLKKLKIDARVERERIKKRSYVKGIYYKNQTVEYLTPGSVPKYPDLVVVDEAAAIPIPVLKRIIPTSTHVFFSSTTQGYEGTGRALVKKFFSELKEENEIKKNFIFSELNMSSSIRYGKNDPVEKWLNSTLLLNVRPLKVKKAPLPNECRLFYVNKKTLFSFHSVTETILRSLVSIFTSSHYKNSPNDMQILADLNTHHIFVLLSPENDILSAAQIVIEGERTREGNLIPHIISEQLCENKIFDTKGIRIVRIATHPEMQSMGYGGEFHKQLEDLLLKKENYSESKKEGISPGIEIFDENIKSLYLRPDEIKIVPFDWMGVSFTLTEKLLKFWSKNKYYPISIKETESKTGGHSILVFKSHRFNFHSVFIRRFIKLIPTCFNFFPITLVFSLIKNQTALPTEDYSTFSELELKRLKDFLLGKITLFSIQDLIPQISRLHFENSYLKLNLSQKAVLMMKGIQLKSFQEIEKELKLEKIHINEIFSKIISKLIEEIENNLKK